MTDVTVVNEPLTYQADSPHSFFVDLARATGVQDQRAMDRLARHAVETRTNPNNVLGTGGEFAPPGYLIANYATAAKVGRPFADLIGSNPLPRGISQINIPRLIGTNILGQDTGIQTGNTEAVDDFDNTSAYNTSAVVSISGQAVVSQQLFDQTPQPGWDTIAYTELTRDYNAALCGQLINGTGTNGQLTGLANFSYPTANTVSGSAVSTNLTAAMIAALWPLMGQAAAAVGNNRGYQPDFWLMAPRRWFAIAGSLDGQGRPVMSPAVRAPAPPTVTGGPAPVSVIHGIPVYTDGGIPTTNWPSGTVGAVADTIYCGRTADMWLFESDPMVQTSVNATAGTLQVRLSLHRYVGFVGNLFTTAFGRVTAIPQPANY